MLLITIILIDGNISRHPFSLRAIETIDTIWEGQGHDQSDCSLGINWRTMEIGKAQAVVVIVGGFSGEWKVVRDKHTVLRGVCRGICKVLFFDMENIYYWERTSMGEMIAHRWDPCLCRWGLLCFCCLQRAGTSCAQISPQCSNPGLDSCKTKTTLLPLFMITPDKYRCLDTTWNLPSGRDSPTVTFGLLISFFGQGLLWLRLA